jgi:hypothetical protein
MDVLDVAARGIERRWNAANTGYGIYYRTAPSNATLPYVIYFFNPSGPSFAMGTDADAEDLDVRFISHSIKDTPTEVADVHQYVENIFNRESLSIAGWKTLMFLRTSGPNLEADPDGGWLEQSDYRVMLQEI